MSMKLADERDKAFVDAVTKDDWNGVKKYAKKYGVPLPDNEDVMKAGIYKAVQHCTRISEEVKMLAAEKCVKLGFSPYTF